MNLGRIPKKTFLAVVVGLLLLAIVVAVVFSQRSSEVNISDITTSKGPVAIAVNFGAYSSRYTLSEKAHIDSTITKLAGQLKLKNTSVTAQAGSLTQEKLGGSLPVKRLLVVVTPVNYTYEVTVYGDENAYSEYFSIIIKCAEHGDNEAKNSTCKDAHDK